MSYYHYTKGCFLPSIVKDGIIETSKTVLEKNEKPVVWLTKSPIWESACNIGKIINHEKLLPGKIYSSDEVQSVTVSDDYMKKEVGMCRILISESLPVISWAKFKYESRISERRYSALDTYSRSIGCPVDKWICTFTPIPEKYWEGIEMFVDNQWVKWDGKIPIKKFVEICLSCNSNKKSEALAKEVVYPENVQNECDFINKYKPDILMLWEVNKHKKGYIEIYVTPDYKPYKCGFQFIDKRIRKSSFKTISESQTGNYALVHFLWEATYTQYRMALPYEIGIMYADWDKSFDN
jgi:hypothetical protein